MSRVDRQSFKNAPCPPDGQTNLPPFPTQPLFCVRAALHSSCPGACVLFTKFVLLRHSSNPSKVFHCALAGLCDRPRASELRPLGRRNVFIYSKFLFFVHFILYYLIGYARLGLESFESCLEIIQI